jgi:predicted nucleotidyltransferase
MTVDILQKMIGLIEAQSSKPPPDGVLALRDEILSRYGRAVQAIVFYGSCLRTMEDRDGIVDLYVLVDRYRSAYGGLLKPLLNKALPPNVFYMEVPYKERKVRSKYAVISVRSFLRGVSTAWFHSYLWGRFCQPSTLVFSLNESVAVEIKRALVQAALTFMARSLPQVPERFSARDLWQRGLLLSYRSELRTERPAKIKALYEASSDHYEQLTRCAISLMPYKVSVASLEAPENYEAHISPLARLWNRTTWAVRGVQGKVLSALRLLKGLLTFEGGPEYIQWKIERHSGIRVTVSPRLKQHPVLSACVMVWRLYRKGGFR